VAACVAAELGVAGSSIELAARITAMVGLASAGVFVSLGYSMGLRRERAALRLILLVPLALCVLLVVALMLDGSFRAHAAAGLVVR
jgi:hypothetical protein